jgi:membrane protein
MRRVWNLGDLTFRQFVWRVLRRADADDVLGQSAKLSYFLVLAVFPLLIFLVALFGVLAPGTNMLQQLLAYWRRVLPGSAYELVLKTLQEISANAGGGKLSLGLVGTLWAASGGMGAVIDGLNRAYKVKEGRPWWKAQLLSILLTIALVIFIVMALSIVLYGNRIGEFAATYVGLGAQFQIVWNIIQWPIGLGFVWLVFALLYRVAPDLHDLEWSHVTPGATVALVLWLLVSMGFRAYLRYFDHYGKTYGSLGAMIVLMLWFYFTGAAILLGGEVNAEIESIAARRGVPDARLPGEKEPGEKRMQAKT